MTVRDDAIEEQPKAKPTPSRRNGKVVFSAGFVYAGATTMSLKGEVFYSEFEVEGNADDIAALTVDASRVRLALEAKRAHTLDNGARLEPGADGQGLSISLRPTYGNAASEIEKLWEQQSLSDDQTTHRLGLRWEPGSRFNLNLSGERREDDGDPAEHAILLKGEMRF